MNRFVDTSLDFLEPLDEVPASRTLAEATDNRPVHKVADKHYPKIKVVAKYAFAKGRQALGWPPDADAAAEAVRKALTKLLPPALLQALEESGNVALQNLPEVRTAGDVEGHPFHGNQWTNAAHTMASQLSGQTPAAPIKTITAYHVTKRKNVESILKTGFDLNKVKPRWQNDMAVSLNKGQQKAADYFTHSDPKTGKPLASGLDTTKYGLLEVKMKGRTFDPYDEPHESNVGGASGYTRSTIGKGFDAAELQNGLVYVYNPKSILSIREVPVPVRAPKEPRAPRARKLKTAGDVEGHEFHGNQWTTGGGGLNLDKNGFDDKGNPGPEAAQRGGALWLYRGSGTDVNDQLRDNDIYEPEVVSGLDQLMRPLGKDTTVVRDASVYANLVPGTMLHEKGYTSTAAERGSFAKGNTVRIDIPAHAPVIRMGDYYKADPEKEIVIGRGSQFEVVGKNHLRWVGQDLKLLETLRATSSTATNGRVVRRSTTAPTRRSRHSTPRRSDRRQTQDFSAKGSTSQPIPT